MSILITKINIKFGQLFKRDLSKILQSVLKVLLSLNKVIHHLFGPCKELMVLLIRLDAHGCLQILLRQLNLGETDDPFRRQLYLSHPNHGRINRLLQQG